MDSPSPRGAASPPAERARGRMAEPIAAALTFLATASVLVLEIAAGRLLAPYVGVSLTTYTGIIGVILAGIALGAWLGGRAADELGAERLLGPTFVLGGIAAIASVPIVTAVGALGLGGNVAAIVILATAGFVAPATILSAVAPMVVRATIRDLDTSGSLVGRLSAVGTAGAIVGTFLTGFVLLGLLPTRLIVVGVGALLVLIGVAVTVRIGRSPAALVGGLVAALAMSGVALGAPAVCHRESAYYCASVVPDEARPNGRTLVLDTLRHAYVDVADPTHLEFRYIRWFAAATAGPVAERQGDVDGLHLGGGGFTFPRYLAVTQAASRHTVLEIDPQIQRIAEEELGFAPSEQIRVRLGDARLSIEMEVDDSFDVVMGDAFGGMSVPWHLTSREFLAEVDRVLRPDGRYVMNVIDGPELRFARAETATLRTLFEHVAVVTDADALAGRRGANIVLVASHEPLDVAAIVDRIDQVDPSGVGQVSLDPALDEFTAGAPVLTDDYAPVDQMLAR